MLRKKGFDFRSKIRVNLEHQQRTLDILVAYMKAGTEDTQDPKTEFNSL